jgi:ectoine hydroxylase-related dioxygenase (phytanoyl-CoA dioxygenase family)
MQNEDPFPVSNNHDQLLHQFRRNGYFLKEDLLPVTELDPLIQDIEEGIENSLKSKRLSSEITTTPSTYFEKRLYWLENKIEDGFFVRQSVTGKHLKTSGLLQLASNNRILDLVEKLIGPEILFHPQYNVQAKMPFERHSQIPWHQDLWFLDREAEATPMVNLWIPLVDATLDNGCLELIQGSQGQGLKNHQALSGYPEDHIGISDTDLPAGEHIACPLIKGGAILFQHKTVHRSRPNLTDSIRWSVDIRYSDARKPTGRNVPGLLLRSEHSPDSVDPSLSKWLQLMETVTDLPYIC